ncbi:MAG: hypothetical protein JW973_12100 [Bacteroidales bacterium]|nr:hypothetical protein [Bacteroidales bacterium]
MPAIKNHIILLVLLIVWGCIDENITQVSEDLEITSSYSIPVGPLTYDINDYLENLDSLNVPWPDSLYYNDTLYPNYRSYLIRDDIKSFNFNQITENLDIIEAIMFRLIISNGYPTGALTQVYFADGDNVYVDSLFADGPYLIPPAAVDNEGIVTAPYEEIRDVYMSPYLINHLEDIRLIIIESTIFTTRPDILHVKFYSHYCFNLHIAVRIRLRFNINEL